MVRLPLFGKEGSGTPVFKILVRALAFNWEFESTSNFGKSCEIKDKLSYHHNQIFD